MQTWEALLIQCSINTLADKNIIFDFYILNYM